MKMIIATENTNLAYNKAITQVAKKYVKRVKLTEGMLNRVEAVIRAFDPCPSCATHARVGCPLFYNFMTSMASLWTM
ncbi:MAG: hypothetical protein ACUVQ8_07045 [Nitrososphaeria archaeon]